MAKLCNFLFLPKTNSCHERARSDCSVTLDCALSWLIFDWRARSSSLGYIQKANSLFYFSNWDKKTNFFQLQIYVQRLTLQINSIYEPSGAEVGKKTRLRVFITLCYIMKLETHSVLGNTFKFSLNSSDNIIYT